MTASHYSKYIRLQPGERSGNQGSVRHLCAIRSMSEVANALGITKQAVHQIERKALRKLRIGLIVEWNDWRETKQTK